MKKIMNIIFILLIALVHLSVNANSVNQGLKEYCKSMGDGLSDDDAREMISQCIEEQSQYYENDSMSEEENSASYEEEPDDLDCYDEAEAIIERDPEADYDMLVQDCLNQNS